MDADYKTLLVELRDRIAIVRMNRDERRNALEYQLRMDLVDCFRTLSDNNEVKAVILTGAGMAFCAGGDLKEIKKGFTVDAARKYVIHANRIILAIRNLEKPVIAAVNGPAMGAGFSIAIACDLIVASERARFSQAFVHIGAIPDLGSTYFMPRLVGMQRAKELAFTGEDLRNQDLLEWGVINHLVPPDKLEEKAIQLGRQIALNPAFALGVAKKLFNATWNCTLEEMLELEAQSQAACFQSKGHMEGIAAFFEKRGEKWGRDK